MASWAVGGELTTGMVDVTTQLARELTDLVNGVT
jgi:hypothetical protein